MSRKTRKLIWSAPLVAVLAVAGALAIFAALSPNGAAAHDEGPSITAHQPPPAVTGIDVTTPTAENGGRTSLRVTWDAPVTTGANTPTKYRVDWSSDNRIWHNVIGGEASDDVLTESMAMSDCTSDDDGDRCYTVMELDPGTTYHFRVFAMNDFGTGPISINETIGTGTTLAVEPPSTITGLTATTYFTDKIVLTWDAPPDNGGADLKWFCITLASSPAGPFTDLADSAEASDCREAENATTDLPDVGTLVEPAGATPITDADPRTIVIPAMKVRTDANGDPVKDADGNEIMDLVTTYSHEKLGKRAAATSPEVINAIGDAIALRYRLYAVTDDGGDTDNRRVSRAASNTATGRTVAPTQEATDPQARPLAPQNLRAVAFSTEAATGDPLALPVPEDGNQGLFFYWNNPANFPDADNRFWTVEVERVVPKDGGGSTWGAVPQEANPQVPTNYAAPQFAVAFNVDEDLTTNPDDPEYGSPTLWGPSASNAQYRVRYVNPGADLEPNTDGFQNTTTDDDIAGAWATITIRKPLDDGYFMSAADHVNDRATDAITTTLPIILRAADNGEHATPSVTANLRFTRHPTDPKNRIDLRWQRNSNANDNNSHKLPTGYVIDRSSDQGMTWERLHRADQPNDLGHSTSYTDSDDITPGKKYTYRVFPVVILTGPDAYGLPAQIDASSEQADVPAKATGLRVDADGQTKLKLSWNAVTNTGGHDLKGYVIQVANDVDNDKQLATGATWLSLETNTNAQEDSDDYDPITVGADADPLEYTYTGSAEQRNGGTADTLIAGSVRWFRVIAITNENDGIDTTGGEEVSIAAGTMPAESSVEEASPTPEDISAAEPEPGMTETLADPGAEDDPTAPEKPQDLTAEAASDSNDLSDGGRGVFLTWNEALMPDTATASYKIERMRMDTGVDALDDTTWQFIARTTGDTSYTDRTALREDTETRMYRVGSEATGQTMVIWVDPAVDYELHPDMHEPESNDLMPATGLSATPGSTAGTVELSWTPGNNATMHWVYAYRADEGEGGYTFKQADTNSSHTLTGLDSGVEYFVGVSAGRGQLPGGEWSTWMTMRVTPN